MNFSIKHTSRFSRPLVFATHRDKLEQLAHHLPAVTRITQRSRTEHAGGIIELEHLWTGDPEHVPAFLRPVIPPAALVWTERATWNPSTWTCNWEIELHALGPAVNLRGSNVFTEKGKGARITVDGTFLFNFEKIPNLPPFITQTAGPAVERFVVGLLVPVIEKSGTAVDDYLEARATAT